MTVYCFVKKIVVLTLGIIPTALLAARVDTVAIRSQAMQHTDSAVVIVPNSYQTSSDRYPTVYLLHGYSGNALTWVSKVPDVAALADIYQMLIVCPDGGYNSWYLDSPVDTASQYETYVGEEIVAFVDQHYRTIADRRGRAITGLSMGGHGALFLAIHHPETFGAAGSMSGGVDLTYDADAWEIAEKLGPYSQDPLRWDSLSVVNMVSQVPDSLALIVDCGTEDFFFKINQHLHEELLKQHIAHDYIVRPGAHNWPYWSRAVQYQLLFFHQYFQLALSERPLPENRSE